MLSNLELPGSGKDLFPKTVAVLVCTEFALHVVTINFDRQKKLLVICVFSKEFLLLVN